MDTLTFSLILSFAVFAATFGMGYYLMDSWSGPLARYIKKLRSTAKAIIIRLTPESVIQLLPVVRQLGNLWFTVDDKFYVTNEHIKPTVGLPPVVFQYSLYADPNDQFAYYATELINQQPQDKKKKSKTPQLPTLNEVINYLMKKEEYLQDIVEAYNNILKNNSTIDEEIRKIKDKRKLTDLDPSITQFVQELNKAISTGIEPALYELSRVQEALSISRQQKEWEFVTDAENRIIDVRSVEPLDVDEFLALTPAGTVQDVQTVAQRNEAIVLKEAEFTPAQAMKYLIIGVVIFMILAGLAFFLKH